MLFRSGIPDGYLGAAWSAMISYFTVMVISYFIGRRYYPLPYEIRRIGLYTAAAIILYVIGEYCWWPTAIWLSYLTRTLLLLLYAAAILRIERPFARS